MFSLCEGTKENKYTYRLLNEISKALNTINTTVAKTFVISKISLGWGMVASWTETASLYVSGIQNVKGFFYEFRNPN